MSIEEYDYFNYSVANAQDKARTGDYKHAIVYLENAIRSLNDLQEEKNRAAMLKEAKALLDQIDDAGNTQYVMEQVKKSYE